MSFSSTSSPSSWNQVPRKPITVKKKTPFLEGVPHCTPCDRSKRALCVATRRGVERGRFVASHSMHLPQLLSAAAVATGVTARGICGKASWCIRVMFPHALLSQEVFQGDRGGSPVDGEKSDYWVRRGAGPASAPRPRSVPTRDILLSAERGASQLLCARASHEGWACWR